MTDVTIIAGHSEKFDKDFIEINYKDIKIKIGLFDAIPYDFQIVDNHLVILKDCNVKRVTRVDSIGELIDELIDALAQFGFCGGSIFVSEHDYDDD